MKIKINRIHSVEVDDIDNIKETKNDVRVYLKEHYPRILKADCNKLTLLLRMVNAGVGSGKIMEIRDQ